MGYSQAQKAESRKKVVQTAARQLRENGIEALGVADCMRSAGLTQGAFYGHFESRDALIVEALKLALGESEARMASRREKGAAAAAASADTNSAPDATSACRDAMLQETVEAYLGQQHYRNPGAGCTLCALAGEARHAAPDVKALLTAHLRRAAASMAQATAAGTGTDALSESDTQRGLGLMALIVGAMTLARAVDDETLAASILTAARTMVLDNACV